MTQSPPRAGAGECPPRGAGPVSRDRNGDDDGAGGMVVAMAGLDASLRPFKGGNVKRAWKTGCRDTGGQG